jgi:3-phosphoshikimate 1-carboxyvinyltransferase
MITIQPGRRTGSVGIPRSKSHEHRLLVADFLAGDYSRLPPAEGDSEDILATKRCLGALKGDSQLCVLDCGESGATRRFLGPVAAALGKSVTFLTRGRLSERPQIDYSDLKSGLHELAGDVSSQFVTGLLFALPLLEGDSQIRFTSPLESRGYVDMTLRVLTGAGIYVAVRDDGFDVPGGQAYVPQPQTKVEADWSGAAFWYAMNAMGSLVMFERLDARSAQPDRAVMELAPRIAAAWKGEPIDVCVSGCPDLFPALAVLAGASAGVTRFSGIRRLRLKESDRVAAMADVLKRFGVGTEAGEDTFVVRGSGGTFRGGSFQAFDDHRVAMAIAVGATVADGPVEIDNPDCAAKSYPGFFEAFARLRKA